MEKKQKVDNVLKITAIILGWLTMFIGYIGGIFLKEYSRGTFSIMVGLVILLGLNGSLKSNQTSNKLNTQEKR